MLCHRMNPISSTSQKSVPLTIDYCGCYSLLKKNPIGQNEEAENNGLEISSHLQRNLSDLHQKDTDIIVGLP